MAHLVVAPLSPKCKVGLTPQIHPRPVLVIDAAILQTFFKALSALLLETIAFLAMSPT